MDFKNIDEILDYAIIKEQEAADFYTYLSESMNKPYMKKVFQSFANEELGHKKKLQEVKSGKYLLPDEKKIQDLKIAEYLVDVDAKSSELDYQKALILAMKREKTSFKLYSDLAENAADQNVRLIFSSLAQEEAKHKLRFEIEYDEYVLTEN